MSNIVDINGATRHVRHHTGSRKARRADAAEPATWRICLAVFIVEALYVVGLVTAVPIGRGAVAVTTALAFLLATVVSARLRA